MMFKYLVLSAVLAISGFPTQASAISLGSAASFALLGGSGVSNAGSSEINNGNVGSAPIAAVSGFPPGIVNNGILYEFANSATTTAHTALIAAYAEARDTLGGISGPADLGGALLTPGVYTYGSEAPWATDGTLTLTLDGQGDSNSQWIFQIGSSLTTPAGAVVSLINGASADHVFWQTTTFTTLGATNTFAGNILAQSAITFGGGTLEGRALAIDGLVTISVAETVNVPVIPEPGTSLLLGSGLVSLLAFKKRLHLRG